MDIWQIRKANLVRLIEQHEGVVRLAERVGLESHSVLSQIVGRKASRNLGFSLARRIERALGLEHGWLDREHPAPASAQTEASDLASRLERLIARLPPQGQRHAQQLVETIEKTLGGRKGRRS